MLNSYSKLPLKQRDYTMVIETLEPVSIVKIIETKIWIESDIAGSKHVVIQHQDGASLPFTYCSFFYNYAFTSNASIRQAAENMAIALGAKEPIEYKERSLKYKSE